MSERLIKYKLKDERYDIYFQSSKNIDSFLAFGLKVTFIMLLFLILLLLLNTFQIIFLLMSLSFHKRAFLFRKTPSAIKEIDGNIQRPKTQGQSETQKQNKICCGNKLEKHE